MKNKVLLSFGIILFALVIFLVPNSMAAVPANLTGDDIIPFEDEELKKYLISYNLDKNNDNEISVNEIKNFSELYITDIPKDLTPLIYANIFSVSISGENIKNLDFLADLTDISTIRKFSIYGSNCNIEDISGITNLKSLETVEIYYCSKITEIPNLSQLSNLNKIQIVGTPITNLDFLSQSKSLETLYIEKGKLNNIEGIRELVNLKEISFNENEISDISCLENLTNLTSLSLTANQIEDASIVSNLVNLQLLNLNKNKLTRIPDLSKITYFTNGKFGEYNNALIPFNDNQIVDISGLENTSFTGIDLSNNKIDDISILSTVSNLKYLNINNNNISDIQCLFGMKNLTSISANNNKITNVKVIDFKPEFDKWNNKINILLNNNLLESVTVSNLENCYSLELENNNLTNDKIIIENSTIFLVKLNRNKIEDINKIISSNNINYLMCAENKIKNIKVENNETITSLDLQKNQISTIPDLSELSKLETINLNYNNISDITPLLKNPSIKAAYLIGNKVNPHNESTFHVMCTFKEYNQYLMLGDCSQFENGELTTVETEKVEVNGEELDTMKIEKGTSKKISDFINEENFPVINTYTVKVLDASGNEKSEDQRVGSKNVIQITNEAGEKIAEYTVVVPGDVTGNGYSRMYDAFQILKDSLFNGNLDEIDMLIRDYDGNGHVRMYDAFQFLKDSLFN